MECRQREHVAGQRYVAYGRRIVREYKAMHEENFLSSWRRADLVGKEQRKDKEEKVREEESGSGKREGAREGEETVVVERRCVNFFPVMLLRSQSRVGFGQLRGFLGRHSG